MKKRNRKWLLMCLCLCLLLSGCQSTNVQETSDVQKSEGRYQIGISFDSFVIERWLRDRDVFESTAKSMGADVNIQNANGDVTEQISQIEYLIEKKVDALIIIAVDCNSLAQVVSKAKNAGIYVISYDRLIQNADSDLYISFDNTKVGQMMAQALIATCESGDIFMINGSPLDNNVALVEEGFKKEIENSPLNIVYTKYCDNWLSEKAFTYVNEGLLTNRNIVGVMCGNDDLASQAFRALAENRMAGKVVLVGQDADLSACQRIVEGTQTMTVYKPVEELAKRTIESTIQMLDGEKLDTTQTMTDGSYKVPYISIDPIAVTKDNMNIIIDSGFHSEEDIYLNVSNEETE